MTGRACRYRGDCLAFKGVLASIHHDTEPTMTPKINGVMTSSAPEGHATNVGVPSHVVQRSHVGTPPMSSHRAVIVPRNPNNPTAPDRTILTVSLNTSMTSA